MRLGKITQAAWNRSVRKPLKKKQCTVGKMAWEQKCAELEQQIADTENEISRCSSDYVKLQELSDKKEVLENQLAEKMDRWVYLNDLAERIAGGEEI